MGRDHAPLGEIMAQEWDEKGNPIAAGKQEWDEKGNPVTKGPDPLKTGAGMEAAAHEQARETPTKAAAKMQPNWTALALEHTPSGADPHNPGNPNLNAIPESARADVNSRLATISSMTTPAMGTLGEIAEARSLRPLIPYVRSAAGAGIGGYLGKEIGRGAGSLVGHPGEGGMIGGFAGGLYGGYRGAKGLPVSIPSWRGALRTVLSEGGEMQVPQTIPAPPLEPPPLEETAAIPGETAAERLRAHRGDVRTPMPRPATIRRGPGEILPEAVSSGPEVRVGEAPRSGTSTLPGGGIIKRPPAGLLPENVPSAPLPARPLKTIPQAGTIPEKSVVSSAPFELEAPPAEREPAVQTELEMPKEKKGSVRRIGELIEQGTGADRLKTIPLREQIGRPPVTLPGRQIGNTVAPEVSEATGPRTVAPEKVPAKFAEEVGKATGAQGPKPGMTLKASIENPNAEAAETPKARLQRIYPDSGTRQQVHIVGEDFYEAAKHDPELVKAGTKLTGPEVRQAGINLGEDLGQMSIGSRKATGNQIRPAEMLSRLIQKGHMPEQIIQAARQTNQ